MACIPPAGRPSPCARRVGEQAKGDQARCYTPFSETRGAGFLALEGLGWNLLDLESHGDEGTVERVVDESGGGDQLSCFIYDPEDHNH